MANDLQIDIDRNSCEDVEAGNVAFDATMAGQSIRIFVEAAAIDSFHLAHASIGDAAWDGPFEKIKNAAESKVLNRGVESGIFRITIQDLIAGQQSQSLD